MPNEPLQRLSTESGWTLSQCARAVNRVGAEDGTPLKYNGSAVHHRLGGTTPRSAAVRRFVVEAFARRLRRPVPHAESGFPTPADQEQRPPLTVEGLIELGRQDMDPSRRSVLGASLFSVALTIPGWPDVIGRAEAVAMNQTQRIGMSDVEMVIAMTERVSDLNDEFGGRYARPMAAAFLINFVSDTTVTVTSSRSSPLSPSDDTAPARNSGAGAFVLRGVTPTCADPCRPRRALTAACT
ncbi:hypothetical protein ACWGII_18580 [Streptomyces sp. NPDC054855]